MMYFVTLFFAAAVAVFVVFLIVAFCADVIYQVYQCVTRIGATKLDTNYVVYVMAANTDSSRPPMYKAYSGHKYHALAKITKWHLELAGRKCIIDEPVPMMIFDGLFS